jgi:hypothetical protein
MAHPRRGERAAVLRVAALRAAVFRAGVRLDAAFLGAVLDEARGLELFPDERVREEEPRADRADAPVRRVLAEAPCRVDFLEAIANEVL